MRLSIKENVEKPWTIDAYKLGTMTKEERNNWLNDAPDGSTITGLYNKDGPYTDIEITIRKESGYEKLYGPMSGNTPIRYSEWKKAGYKDPYISRTIRDASEGTSKYYLCIQND